MSKTRLKELSGFYDLTYGIADHEAVFFAQNNATPGTLTGPSQLAYHDTEPDVRPWNLSVDEIPTGGALFTSGAAGRST